MSCYPYVCSCPLLLLLHVLMLLHMLLPSCVQVSCKDTATPFVAFGVIAVACVVAAAFAVAYAGTAAFG